MNQAAAPELIRRLQAELAPGTLTTEASELDAYGHDWTHVHTPAPCAVVWPRSTEEVACVVRACSELRVPVVPSGGRTGLAAGAMAKDGELVLSLERMRRLWPVDVLGQSLRVQAGAVTEAVHQHCARYGLTWPVDFASKGQSQVGGNIATNAGGVKVIRYGLTRQWVLGLQVVTAAGNVLELNGALEKNNTGFDLRQLFIGSEGTLGIITEATLKLTRLPEKLEVALFGVPDLESVVALFREARQGPFTITAYEMFGAACLRRVEQHRKLHAPLSAPAPYYVLLEVERADRGALEDWLLGLLRDGQMLDGTLAQSTSQAAGLWALREAVSESLSATGLPHKNDVALPIAHLEAFCRALGDFFERRYPGWEIALFGHIGDGNLHINVMKPDTLSAEAFHARTSEADHDIFALVRRFGGSISAEHGIGLLKKPYLGYTRSPAEIELLRVVKRALDPLNILNPGKIFDADG
jgi:FAD/FMN-containing dehydrogenase